MVPASKIVEIPQVRDLMEGIVPYSKRHASRIDRLSRSIFLLDYTLARMNVLLPLDEPEHKDSALALQATSWPTIGNLDQVELGSEEKETIMTDANVGDDSRIAFDNGGREIVEPVSPENVEEEMVEPVSPKLGSTKRKKSLGSKKKRRKSVGLR